MRIQTIKLVKTSKMPGSSFGLPTAECKTGSKLRKIKGTVCSKCYACKGHYAMYKLITINQQERLAQFLADPDLWVTSMVCALNNERWFRWFDSGDLHSTLMLSKIVEVARQTPWCNHWISTRERGFLREYLKSNTFPENLCVRVSANYPDVPSKPVAGCNTGNVHKALPPIGHECPAPQQGGKCDMCRACWDTSIMSVSYKEH